MLKILKGTKHEFLDDFAEYRRKWERIEIDVGTGDGRFVYSKAKVNPHVLYIGLDPVAENMQKYSSKSIQKPSKGGVGNVMFLIAAVEELPEELAKTADKIHVTLPWGSLLEGIVKGTPCVLKNLVMLSKSNAEFEFCFTYDVIHEANEIGKRELPTISIEYLRKDLAERYSACGLKLKEVNVLTEKALRVYNSTWGKRLGFGRPREVFVLKGSID